jgi:hypothetical protein
VSGAPETLLVHHEDEFFTVNCLAMRPGRVIMSETSSRTLERRRHRGDPDRVRGGLPRSGGIHCSTAPLVRDAL